MSKTWIIGDIHGESKKLIKLLALIKFDYENDTLIQLGDVVDRGPDSYGCVEELLKIKNLIAIKGNHDDTWFEAYCGQGINPLFSQGGSKTDDSYKKYCHEKDAYPGYEIPQEHFDFFANQKLYYIDADNNCFVHGGFDRHHLIEEQKKDAFLWDRNLFMSALSFKDMSGGYKFKTKNKFKRIFVGHTPTIYWSSKEEKSQGGLIVKRGEPITTPIKAGNIWNVDTGCGKGDFPLTAMNIDTEEYYQINE